MVVKVAYDFSFHNYRALKLLKFLAFQYRSQELIYRRLLLNSQFRREGSTSVLINMGNTPAVVGSLFIPFPFSIYTSPPNSFTLIFVFLVSNTPAGDTL